MRWPGTSTASSNLMGHSTRTHWSKRGLGMPPPEFTWMEVVAEGEGARDGSSTTRAVKRVIDGPNDGASPARWLSTCSTVVFRLACMRLKRSATPVGTVPFDLRETRHRAARGLMDGRRLLQSMSAVRRAMAEMGLAGCCAWCDAPDTPGSERCRTCIATHRSVRDRLAAGADGPIDQAARHLLSLMAEPHRHDHDPVHGPVLKEQMRRLGVASRNTQPHRPMWKRPLPPAARVKRKRGQQRGQSAG